MKRPGVLLVEILVAIALFAIGILAIAASLTFSLGAITRSRDATITNQELINNVNVYMLGRVISHDVSPSGAQVSVISDNQEISIGDGSINFTIYNYKLDDKKSSSYFIFQRKD